MHARLTRFDGAPDRIDDAVRQTEDVWLPKLREIDGFRGVTSLADRSTGTIVAITFWESEDAMRASDEKITNVRKDVAEAVAVRSQPTLEHYEVIVQTS
jgi:heme-degrading monooxygenase HmoA